MAEAERLQPVRGSKLNRMAALPADGRAVPTTHQAKQEDKMIEYPKIETLYDRDERTHKVITSQLWLAEFGNIKTWHVTEKIDGTNVRISFTSPDKIIFSGRTDNAQMPVKLLDHLLQVFTVDKLAAVFQETESEVMIFGEGYGEKIQNGGNYRSGISFRLFDILIGGWWLEPDSLTAIADGLGVKMVPYLGIIDNLPASRDELASILHGSVVAAEEKGQEYQAEGIVARTHPLLLRRSGQRLVWKLKFKDF